MKSKDDIIKLIIESKQELKSYSHVDHPSSCAFIEGRIKALEWVLDLDDSTKA
jgi:hypothetical protein